MAERKRIVVVGGGVAGSTVAKSFDSEADVTLIDPKDYFEIPYAALRCTVEPKFAQRSIVKHTEYLKKAKLVQSSAQSVSDSAVVAASGDRIPYDFLVVCTGSTYTGPATKAERIKEFEADYEKVKAADSILIIGGGPVGVELAGEIVVDFPTKKVTLIQSGDRLIDFLGPKASEKTLKWLQSRNVEVILNDRIQLDGLAGPIYTTSKGRTIKADAHFVCVGKRVASSWLRDSELSSLLDDQGRLKVDANLRVEGKKNVFACGDIANTVEIKQGFLAGKQAAVVTENIKKLSKDPKGSKLAVYTPLKAPFGIVSLGRSAGVAQLPFATIIGWLPGTLKSKDLFVGKSRKALGLAS
jgi:NADH dehydrogenase FAD-containing subunit